MKQPSSVIAELVRNGETQAGAHLLGHPAQPLLAVDAATMMPPFLTGKRRYVLAALDVGKQKKIALQTPQINRIVNSPVGACTAGFHHATKHGVISLTKSAAP